MIIAQGSKVFANGESWVDWVLLRGAHDKSQAIELADLDDSDHYGGPGAPYYRRPAVRTSRNYTLVCVVGGLDI